MFINYVTACLSQSIIQNQEVTKYDYFIFSLVSLYSICGRASMISFCFKAITNQAFDINTLNLSLESCWGDYDHLLLRCDQNSYGNRSPLFEYESVYFCR